MKKIEEIFERDNLENQQQDLTEALDVVQDTIVQLQDQLEQLPEDPVPQEPLNNRILNEIINAG